MVRFREYGKLRVQGKSDSAQNASWRGQDADRQRSQRLPLDPAGHPPRSPGGAHRRQRSLALCSPSVSFCRASAGRGTGVHRVLSVGAGGQRSHHRGTATVAIRDPALAGALAAGRRIPVHRARPSPICSPSQACLRRPACSMQTADHGLALYDLARCVSLLVLGYAFTKYGNGKIRSSITDASWEASSLSSLRFGRNLDRHRQARPLAGPVEWRRTRRP